MLADVGGINDAETILGQDGLVEELIEVEQGVDLGGGRGCLGGGGTLLHFFLEIQVIIVCGLDVLLQVDQLIRFSQFNFDKRYDWPCRSCLFELKEYLKHQEHSFDYQKVLSLIQTFHKLNQI